jgi:hypothetical protein
MIKRGKPFAYRPLHLPVAQSKYASGHRVPVAKPPAVIHVPRTPTVPPPAQCKTGMRLPAPAFTPRPHSRPGPPVAQLKSSRVVQRLVTVKAGSTREDLLRSMLRIDRNQVKQLGRTRLSIALRELERSDYFHGVIDLANEQMVGLIYFQAVRMDQLPRSQRIMEETDHVLGDNAKFFRRLDKKYELAIIGSGSAAAYYIDTLGVGYDHRYTMLVGGEDPWAERRGEGITYINHVPAQINYPSEGVPGYSGVFVGRRAFAARTKGIIEQAIPLRNRFYGQVKGVTRDTTGQTAEYVIEMADGTKRYASKVIVATGAGPHMYTSADVAALPEESKQRVIDMDTFVRETAFNERGHNVRVLVQGPNAAVDAVALAVNKNWRVTWFVNTTPPVYLPGTQYRLGTVPLYKTRNVSIAKLGDTALRVTADVRKCRVNHQRADPDELAEKDKADVVNRYWEPEQHQTFDVDYVVYGIGQKATATGAVGDILKTFNARQDFAAVYNKSGRYSEVRQGDDLQFADEHAVAVRLNPALGVRDQGLFVIGAAAVSYTPQFKDKLKAVTKFQSADIVAYEQLGGIRSAMYGFNEHLPPDIATRVDFSHADPTVLRAHMALKYPHLREADATRLINQILSHRKTGHHPHGYDTWWQRHWEQNLAWWNERGRRR